MTEASGSQSHVDDVDWLRYALRRIHRIVDKPRPEMTEDEFTIFTFAQNALALGDPIIAAPARGAGARLCRICLAEWTFRSSPDHVYGCPLGEVTLAAREDQIDH